MWTVDDIVVTSIKRYIYKCHFIDFRMQKDLHLSSEQLLVLIFMQNDFLITILLFVTDRR